MGFCSFVLSAMFVHSSLFFILFSLVGSLRTCVLRFDFRTPWVYSESTAILKSERTQIESIFVILWRHFVPMTILSRLKWKAVVAVKHENQFDRSDSIEFLVLCLAESANEQAHGRGNGNFNWLTVPSRVTVRQIQKTALKCPKTNMQKQMLIEIMAHQTSVKAELNDRSIWYLLFVRVD